MKEHYIRGEGKMRKLLLTVILAMAFATGCQQEEQDRVIAQQDQVELIGLEEINIPQEDNVGEFEEDVFIVEEAENWNDYGRDIKRVNKDGSSKLIDDQVDSWEVIRTNDQDIVNYVKNHQFKTYNVKTDQKETHYSVESGTEIEILRDEATKKNYVALKKSYVDSLYYSSYFCDLALLDLESGEVILEDSQVAMWGTMYINNGVFCYPQKEDYIIAHDDVGANKIISYNIANEKKKHS